MKEVKELLLDKYFYDDGLMGLHENDYKVIDGKTYARPDNGILYAVYAYFGFYKHDLLDDNDAARFKQSVELLTIKPGLYKKRSYSDKQNSIDNYVAIVAGSVLFNTYHRQEVCTYGSKHGWHFENVEGNEWRSWRQGSDVCWYKLCSGWRPTAWEFLWFMLSVLYSGYFEKAHHTSETLMTYLRLQSIEIVAPSFKTFKHGWMYDVILLLKKVWESRLMHKTYGLGIYGTIKRYFTKKQPIKHLYKGIKY